MVAKKRVASWVVTDDFWARVAPLIPVRERPPNQEYARRAGGGRKPKAARLAFEGIVYVMRTGCQWKALPKERFGSASAIHKRFFEWESAGGYSRRSGLRGWRSTTTWWGSPGAGRVSMGPCSRPRWHKNRSGPTRLIGEKSGSKRHLLVDGRGVTLSFIVIGSNRHDVTQLDAVLSSIMVKREAPSERRSKHLCLDAGYRGEPALKTIERHGYIPHVASRMQEKKAKQRYPGKTARRWIVEVCHSWFNRFRKLLVRYEKLERSFLALNHLAAGIIAFRKVHLKIKIIYG